MSKTIDQRVVEMQFDNKNFEKNVATSMSTLDKLKEKLNFGGAAKGINELNGAMKEFNPGILEKSLDKLGDGISTRFIAWKRIVENFVDSIYAKIESTVKEMSGLNNMVAGWEKFGEKTMSVSTLAAQGYELEEINEQLERLNWFTDETSYNFTAMVGEIGKFTASGQGLEDSVTAMMGIANWAALSGQNASTASRAMYQLSQAMSKGALRYDDWKSIQNASMDTKEFRNMAAEAAIALGSLRKVGEDAYRLVYEAADGTAKLSDEVVTLNDLFTSDYLTRKEWLDTDVMMYTFNAYGKASKTLKALIDDEWEGVQTASSAMDILEKKAKELAKELIKADSRLSEDDALNKALTQISLESVKNIPDVIAEVQAYQQSIKAATNEDISFEKALEDLGYGIDEMSLKALKAAQQARTWTDVIDSVKDAVSTGWMNTFEKLFGNQEEAVGLWTRLANDFWDIFAAGGEDRNNMFDLWRNYIDPMVRERLEEATSIPSQVKEVLGDALGASTLNGRDLLFSEDENNLGAIISLLQTLKDLLGVIKDAWNETFYGTTDADEIAWKKADMLMAITKALKAFADAIAIDDKKADKLRRTFKGLFGLLGIIKDFLSALLGTVWKSLGSMFGDVNFDILDLTANIGDSIVAFREWLKNNNIFEKAFGAIGNTISGIANFIRNLVDNIKSIPIVATILEKITSSFGKAKEYGEEFFSKISSGEKIGDVFKSIFDKIKSTSSIIQFFAGIIEKIKGVVSGLFNSFGGGVEGVKTFFGNIVTSIKDGLGNIGTTISNFIKMIFGAKDDTNDAMEDVEKGVDNFTKDLGDKLGESTFGRLISGIVTVITKVFDAIVTKFQEFAENVNGEKIVGLIIGSGIFVFILKLLLAFTAFLEFFGTLGDVFEDIGKTVKKFGKAFTKTVKGIGKGIQNNLNAKALVSVATAVLMLVGALLVLYLLPDMGKLIGVASIVVGIMIALTVLSAVAQKSDGLWKLATVLGTVSLALIALTYAMKAVLDFKDAGSALAAVGIVALLSILLGAIVALGLVAAKIMKEMDANGGLNKQLQSLAMMIISISASLFIMALAMKLIGTIDPNAVDKSIIAMITMVGSIMGLIAVSHFLQNAKFEGIGKMMLGVAASFLILAGAIALFGIIPDKIFNKGYVSLVKVLGIVVILIAISSIAKEGASSAGSMLIKVAFAFAILVGVIKLISLLELGEIIKGIAVLSAFTYLTLALMLVSNVAGPAAAKAGLMLLEVSGAMLILTGVMWALAYLPTEGLVKAGIVVGGLMVLFALLIAMTHFAEDVKSTIIALTIAIVSLGAVIFALALLDNEGIIKAGVAMGLVMGMLALIVAMTHFAKSAMGTLIVLTVAIGVIGGLLIAMACVGNPDDAIKNAGAIAILLGTMGVVALVVSMIGNFSGGLMAGIAGLTIMTGVILILSLILIGMSAGNYAAYIPIAVSLSMLLLAMSAVMAIVTLAGTNWVGAAAGIAGLLIMSIVVKIVSDILTGMSEGNYAAYISVALALSSLLLVMSGTMLILGAAGLLAAPAITGAIVLGVVMAALFLLVQYVGQLVSATPQIQEFLDAGIPVLEKLAYALGSVIGNIVGGIIEGAGTAVLNLLPILGQKLSEFAVYSMPFIATMQTVDDKVLKGVGIIVGAIAAMTAAEFLDGLSNFASGIFGTKTDSSSLIDTLTDIGNAVVALNSILTQDGVELDIDAIEAATNAAQMLSGLANNLPAHGGAWQALAGDTTLTQFAEDMMGFAPKMVRVAEELSKGEIDSSKVEASINAAKMFAGLATNLPAHGGAWQGLIGDNTLTDFAMDMLGFAPKMSKVAEYLSDGNINAQAVDAAVNAAQMLLGLANGLPNIGGILKVFTGRKQTLTEFGNDILNVGIGIKNFSNQVTDINQSAVTTATTALDVLATLANKLPESKGVFGWFTGGNIDVKAFTDLMPSLAESIRTFSSELVKDDGINVKAVNAAGTTLSALATIGELPDVDKILVVTSKLPSVAANIKSFSDALGDEDFKGNVSIETIAKVIKELQETENGLAFTEYKKITTAFDKVESLARLVSNMSVADPKRIELFGQALEKLGTGGITEFLKSFKDGTSELSDAGVIMLNSMIRGIKDNDSLFADAFKNLADQGVSAIRTKYDDYKSAGEYLVSGLQSGIGETESDAAASTNGIGSQLSTDWMADIGGGLDISNLSTSISGFKTDILGENGLGFDTSSIGTGWMSDIGGGLDISNLSNSISGFKTDILGEDGLGFDVSSIGTGWMSEIGGGFDISNLPIGDFQTVLTGDSGLGFDVSSVGTDWIGDLTGSIGSDENQKSIKEAGKGVSEKLIEGFNSNKTNLDTAGTQAVNGLLTAISTMAPQVKEAGVEISKSLTSGVELSLKIASPSRVMYGLGEYAGDGFINALNSYIDISNGVGEDLGESATDGLRDALQKSASMFDTTVDVEPTIRPVLDLSNIDEGLGQMNGMFNASRSVQLAGTASVQMATNGANIQNDIKVDNTDVVAAIGTLKGDISDMANRLSNLQVRLNNDVLVGEMVAPMNKALGITYRHNKREK